MLLLMAWLCLCNSCPGLALIALLFWIVSD